MGGTKAKAVSVEVQETTLRIAVDGVILLAGDWEFKITPEEDPDWEIKDVDGRRALRLLVRKTPVAPGMSIVTWWSKILKGEPEIDVTDIVGRKKEATESFSKAWNEAHLRFRERTQEWRQIEIDTSGTTPTEDAPMEDVSAAM